MLYKFDQQTKGHDLGSVLCQVKMISPFIIYTSRSLFILFTRSYIYLTDIYRKYVNFRFEKYRQYKKITQEFVKHRIIYFIYF